MSAAKKQNKNSFRKLTSGKRTGRLGTAFSYTFDCEKKLPTTEEIIANIRIAGKKTDCIIVRANERSVEITVEQDLGEEVEKATLCWEEVSLLKKLVDELSLLTDDDAPRFRLSEEVFDGIAKSLFCKSKQPSFRKDEHAPNVSQLNAICKSFQKSLAVIWGPPGSGKTRTIARAVEAHVKDGRRVLLVSHANSAVDQLLRGVAEQLSDNYYKSGEVIRLGQTQDKDLARDFPLIDPEAVASGQEQILAEELMLLENDKAKILTDIAKLEAYKKWEEELAGGSLQMQKIVDEAELIEQQHFQLMKEIAQIEETLSLIEPCATSPPNTQTDIKFANLKKQLHDEIATRNKTLDQLQVRHEALASALNKASSICAELVNKLSDGTLAPCKRDVSIDEAIVSARKEISAVESSISSLNSKNKNKSTSMEIINKAKVVACTLFKTVNAAKYLEPFDIVILDEASMAPQAYLYWACSLASLGATVCGDFKQLPPVAQANTEPGISWYVKSIFDRLGVCTVEKALDDPRVALLDTQYRMTPAIGDLSNNLFYGGKLKNAPSTASLKFEDSLSSTTPLILIDTSQMGAYCQRIEGEGRFNMYEAVLCNYILSMIAQNAPSISVGVCSPYNLHARVVKGLCDDLKCKDFCSDTVHKYQGRERDVMIFTCADSTGVSNAPMFDKDRDAEILLNVALTRARKKVYLIANVQFFKKLGASKTINRVIDYLASNGMVICASSLDLNSQTERIEKQVEKLEDQKLRSLLTASGSLQSYPHVFYKNATSFELPHSP